MTDTLTNKPLNLFPDFSIFLFGGILQFIVVYLGVPLLSKNGIMPLGSWMILSIPIIFLPILIAGWLIIKMEGTKNGLSERLWLRKLSKADWLWCLLGFVLMGLGSAITFKVCNSLGLNSSPPFARHVQAWAQGHLWMFGLFLIYWPFNILGENLVWRGVILPRMVGRFGKAAWMINALMWGIFHLAFGVGNLIVLLPTLVVVPYIAQKTRNTWSAIILHACLSGPGFIALALGLMK